MTDEELEEMGLRSLDLRFTDTNIILVNRSRLKAGVAGAKFITQRVDDMIAHGNEIVKAVGTADPELNKAIQNLKTFLGEK